MKCRHKYIRNTPSTMMYLKNGKDCDKQTPIMKNLSILSILLLCVISSTSCVGDKTRALCDDEQHTCYQTTERDCLGLSTETHDECIYKRRCLEKCGREYQQCRGRDVIPNDADYENALSLECASEQ